MEPEPENEQAEDLVPEVLWDRVAWFTDRVSHEEFELVRAARERFEPLMVKSLRDVASEPARYAQEARHHGHQCALAFLAESGAATAFPAILQFLAGIRGFEDALLPGDMIMEDLPSILASTYDGNFDAMKALIEDESADEFVRVATVDAMGILATCEAVKRNDLSTCLGSLIQTLPREPSLVWEEVAVLALQFRLTEHRDVIEQLIASNVVESTSSDDIVSAFNSNTLPYVPVRPEFVDDAVELIDVWQECDWKPDASGHGDDEELTDHDEEATWDDDGAPESVDEPGVPFVRETPKVGRNEPCPCGSGKKYKRCCEGK